LNRIIALDARSCGLRPVFEGQTRNWGQSIVFGTPNDVTVSQNCTLTPIS